LTADAAAAVLRVLAGDITPFVSAMLFFALALRGMAALFALALVADLATAATSAASVVASAAAPVDSCVELVASASGSAEAVTVLLPRPGAKIPSVLRRDQRSVAAVAPTKGPTQKTR